MRRNKEKVYQTILFSLPADSTEMSTNTGMPMIDETFKLNQQFITVDTHEEICVIMQLGRKPAEIFTTLSLNLTIGEDHGI